jgi:transporter family-2 protein
MSFSNGLGILAAVGAGLLIGMQAPLTNLLRQRLGLWGMAVGVHVAGLTVALLAMLTIERQTGRPWGSWWWLVVVAGWGGLGILVTLAMAVGRLGAATALGISIAVQLVATVVIDHLGWLGVEARPLTWPRALGAVLLLVGARLVMGRG